MDRAVILTSGGINSTVAVAVAREQYEPALLHIAWGHRTAERELACFEQIASTYGIEKTMVAELSCLSVFGGNARSSKRIPVEDASTLGQGNPATFMLGLMPSMLSIAASWAGAIGARRIIVGTAENYALPGPAISDLYPDYKSEFIQTFNLMLSYAKPSERELSVEAPLLELARDEIIQLGHNLQAPFESTWSCYRDNENPCGRCLGCVMRSVGFIRSGIPDPLMADTASVGF